MEALMRALLYLFLALFASNSVLCAQAKTIVERLGFPAGTKLLILHADDLGAAHSIDAASFDALDHGAISSGSIMMPTPWVTEVAAYARSRPNADLGLHLTLTSEWDTFRWGSVESKDKVPTLLDSAGNFPPDDAHRANIAEVERELRAQVRLALAMGIHPTHVDSHMGSLFANPALMATYIKIAHEFHLPFLTLRTNPFGGPPPPLTADDIPLDAVIIADENVPRDKWKEFYLNAVASLKPGLSEIIVHLGHDDAELQAVMVNHEPYGSAWRQRDYDVVNSPEFKKALKDNNIILIPWSAVGRLIQQMH
jgi:predicted glycoside hydrolase/deacetylase ChbG (UPF0249 family)